jgi:hypothetical protein
MYHSSSGLQDVSPAVVSGAFLWCMRACQPDRAINRDRSNATLSFLDILSARVLGRMLRKPNADGTIAVNGAACPWDIAVLLVAADLVGARAY